MAEIGDTTFQGQHTPRSRTVALKKTISISKELAMYKSLSNFLLLFSCFTNMFAQWVQTNGPVGPQAVLQSVTFIALPNY